MMLGKQLNLGMGFLLGKLKLTQKLVDLSNINNPLIQVKDHFNADMIVCRDVVHHADEGMHWGRFGAW